MATSSPRNHGLLLIDGEASSQIVFSDVPLSFMMGVDPNTGMVMDRHHPLCGTCLKDKIVVIPRGRGSCSGSGVILELLIESAAPAALIFSDNEEILTLGVLVSKFMFEKSIPVVQLDDNELFERLETADNVRIQEGSLYIGSDRFPLSSVGPASLDLTEKDRELLEGKDCSVATRMAMEIVVAFATIQQAPSLVDVTQAHIDACVYAGKTSLLIPQRLRSLGAKFRVPSTCNSLNVDRQRWRQLGADPEISQAAMEIGDLYLAMGSKMSFTCAPYLLDTKPEAGEQIGWSESNAVVFANSVLGAQTQKYPDYLDVMIGLTGRAPYAGCHSPSGRLPKILVRTPELESWDDSLFPLLGYHIGGIVGADIPLIYGLEESGATNIDLKGFSAAFATSSSAPMFLVNGITMEARAIEGLRDVTIKIGDLQNTWKGLNTARAASVDLVALGNPHFALEEFEHIARLCKGKRVRRNGQVIITTSQHIYSQAAKRGYLDVVEEFGARLVTDTCWCMIDDPVLPVQARTIMTNSAKYAHYGPGMTKRDFHFGSLAACVDAACSGEIDIEDVQPSWLFGTRN